MTSVSRSIISALNPHRHTLVLTHTVQGRSVWERRIAHYECTTSALTCLAGIQTSLFMIWHIIHSTFIHAYTASPSCPCWFYSRTPLSGVFTHARASPQDFRADGEYRWWLINGLFLKSWRLFYQKIPLIAHELLNAITQDAVIERINFARWQRVLIYKNSQECWQMPLIQHIYSRAYIPSNLLSSLHIFLFSSIFGVKYPFKPRLLKWQILQNL